MNIFKKLLILTVVFNVFAVACKEEDNPLPPAISFKTGDIYTSDGAVVAVGKAVRFGIQARSTQSNITNFTVKKHLPDGIIITVMDTGLNSAELNLDKVFYQNVEDSAEWVFTVMNRDRLSAAVSKKIYKDPNSTFGGIYHHQNITMGYQENHEFGQFLNPASGKVYFEDSAVLIQEQIDMLAYYIEDEDLPSPVFSSPGEVDHFGTEPGIFYPGILNWNTRNYTLWDISVDDDPVPAEQFNHCHNDSLLIVAYDEAWGKKKFKWATDGRVIPFLTAAGKKGLIKVNNASLNPQGTINFDIKIQQ